MWSGLARLHPGGNSTAAPCPASRSGPWLCGASLAPSATSVVAGVVPASGRAPGSPSRGSDRVPDIAPSARFSAEWDAALLTQDSALSTQHSRNPGGWGRAGGVAPRLVLRLAEPARERRDHRQRVDDAARYPHQEPAELLVGLRREPPAGAQQRQGAQGIDRPDIRGVEAGRREGQDDAENAPGGERREEIADRRQRR